MFIGRNSETEFNTVFFLSLYDFFFFCLSYRGDLCLERTEKSFHLSLYMENYICTLYVLQFPDPRKMQINLTGFLNGRNARSFMGELWDLLVSAQESVTGIPEAFLQQKKDQIKKRLVIIDFCLYLVVNIIRKLVNSQTHSILKLFAILESTYKENMFLGSI